MTVLTVIEVRTGKIEFANNIDLLAGLVKKLEADFFAEGVSY